MSTLFRKPPVSIHIFPHLSSVLFFLFFPSLSLRAHIITFLFSYFLHLVLVFSAFALHCFFAGRSGFGGVWKICSYILWCLNSSLASFLAGCCRFVLLVVLLASPSCCILVVFDVWALGVRGVFKRGILFVP